MFPTRRQRATPYLFSERDICRLLQEARSLRRPLRAARNEALLRLLAVSGLRVGEAIALQREDVDLDAGLITIRQAKHGRVRLVPLHPTATEALRRYASKRDRLIAQPGASPNTIAAYCQTFRLLLQFASERIGKPPSELDIAQLDARLIAAFLEHLEKARGNSVRSRNNRLAAIHSLFTYIALHHPEHAASIQRVLAIPHKRTERNLVTYLTEAEVDALLEACDQTSWTGRRDHAMFALTIQAGLRISELAGLACADITLSTGANVHTVGNAPKRRRRFITPA